MKVVLFGCSAVNVEEMQLALGLRWPNLISLVESSGEQAGHKVLLETPDLVVAFSDLNEPDMFGTISGIREFSDVPIIAVECQSEYSDPLTVVRALDTGADRAVR